MSQTRCRRASWWVALVGVLSGCGGPAESLHPDEAAAVAAIRKLGGKVEFDAERRAIKVHLHATAVQNDDLVLLAKLPNLQNLSLGKTQIGDDGLAHLAGCARLETLSLNSTNVTDSGLKPLMKLVNLKTLNVQETKVSRAGSAQLRRALPDLKVSP